MDFNSWLNLRSYLRMQIAEILKQKLESEKDKSEFAKSVALGLVRNTEFRKSVFDTEDQQGYYKDNVWVEPVHLSKSRNETSSSD